MPPPDPASPEELIRRLPAAVRDTVRATLESVRTADRGPRTTIEPDRKKGHRTLDDAIALLKELGAEGALTRHGTLGQGGMGIVYLAEQRSLMREVAVKGVKSEAQSPDATLKLLREAWITGALEHPNVVPVHDVRLDASGQPQIVLKKIEGKPWSELFADRVAIKERFGANDPVDWNLRVFLQVVTAIHYAHTRGFVHRDLKPENVMIGSFGEVYVVDWGLALALKDDGTGRFPLAEHSRELAGTPSYMAPEMLGGESAKISERTDVYLLGSVLFELATGAPPRDGPNLLAVIAQVLEPPKVPPTVPGELAHLIRRAMAFAPEDRFESADALRVAVAAYLAHRGSIQLAEEAMERLTELRALRPPPTSEGVLNEGTGPRAADGPEDEALTVRADALFAECRFAFQQALRGWPDNQLAKDGLKQTLEDRIGHELLVGNIAFAGHLLTELPEPDPALTERVEAARKKDQAERAREEAQRRDLDPSIGRRTRAFTGLVMSTVWVLAPLAMWFLGGYDPWINEYPGAIAGTLMLMGVGLAVQIWARDSLSKTQMNRSLVRSVRISLVGQLALLVGSYMAGIPFTNAHTILVLVWGIGVALTANVVERRLLPAAGAYLVGFLVLTRWPELRHAVTASANFVLLLSIVFLWARADDMMEPVRRARERQERRRSLRPPA